MDILRVTTNRRYRHNLSSLHPETLLLSFNKNKKALNIDRKLYIANVNTSDSYQKSYKKLFVTFNKDKMLSFISKLAKRLFYPSVLLPALT